MRHHPREPTFARRLLALFEYGTQPRLESRPPIHVTVPGKRSQDRLQLLNIRRRGRITRTALAINQIAKLPEPPGRKIIPRLLPTPRQPGRPSAPIQLPDQLGTPRSNPLVSNI